MFGRAPILEQQSAFIFDDSRPTTAVAPTVVANIQRGHQQSRTPKPAHVLLQTRLLTVSFGLMDWDSTGDTLPLAQVRIKGR